MFHGAIISCYFQCLSLSDVIKFFILVQQEMKRGGDFFENMNDFVAWLKLVLTHSNNQIFLTPATAIIFFPKCSKECEKDFLRDCQ